MSHLSSEYKKLREKRNISATIGYCFVVVLIVLLVMSSTITETYVSVLESERADAMESLAVASSTALGHTRINEGMDYPLPVYTYADDKPYIIDIYTKAGNSFLRLYTSTDYQSTQQYYLSDVGEEYNECFELQKTAFTRRTDPADNTTYVCAIAPIISSENTVAGILEVRMPMSDYSATVNGMSLSWIFTIFSIAVTMGILIFEINLLVTTLLKGYTGNVPVLIIYGENAVRFATFMMACGAIMQPLVLASYIKQATFEYMDFFGQILICIGLMLYALGFFGFSVIRKLVKSKLTERIALLMTTVVGFMLSVIVGIIGNFVVTMLLILPIAFCYGFSFDTLRDYRINASKLGYKDKGFEDRTIHNIQLGGYFLGVSVGAVIAGICFERFGLLFVSIISGIVLIIAAFSMVSFFRDNKCVRESLLPINKWMEVLSDKYTGRFMVSTFVILGVIVSFLLVFVPNYLPMVGISLATVSFYYLVSAFMALFVAGVIKNRYAHVLTSKIRVIISSACAFTGLVIFAVFPAAKTLVVTCALLGISLGIHDYYYIYVLFLLSNSRLKINTRKAAEMSFLMGLLIAAPVFACALIINNIRIVFAIGCLVFFVASFIYPMSAYSNDVDDKDVSLKKAPKAPKPSKAPKAASKTTEPETTAFGQEQPQGNIPPVAPSDPSYLYQQQPQTVPAYDPNAYQNGYYQDQTGYQAYPDPTAPYGYDAYGNPVVSEPQPPRRDNFIDDLVDSINSEPDGSYDDYYPQGGDDNGYVE